MKIMRYTPDDTNTDEKKQFWFQHGLHHRIRQLVARCEFPTLRHLVNRCIAAEKERLTWEDRQRNKKRRADQPMRDRPFQKTGVHHHPCPGATTAPAPSHQTGTSEGEATRTTTTGDQLKVEEATTASSRGSELTPVPLRLFASPATSLTTSPSTAPTRGPKCLRAAQHLLAVLRRRLAPPTMVA